MADPLRCTLPPGRHGLPREFVKANQRTRLDEALAQALAEVGWRNLSVAEIVKRAHVSRRTWYEHFDGKDEAVADLVRSGFSELADEVHQLGSLRAAVEHFAEQKPHLIRAMFIEGPIAVPEVYAVGVASLAEHLTEPSVDGRLYVVGGIALVLQQQLCCGRSVSLSGLGGGER